MFGVPWQDVELNDVEAFLRNIDEPDQGLTWEAKAGTVHRGAIHKAVSAFGNSILGGFLILGANWDAERARWSLPGVVIPGDEPSTWVAQVASSMRGIFVVEPRSWRHGIGYVVVVGIPPAPEAPLITPSGVIYQRVSGSSPPVTDPTVLADLFARGENARKRALSTAQFVQKAIDPAPAVAYVILGLAATGRPSDATTALYQTRCLDAIRAAVMVDATAEWHKPVLKVDAEGVRAHRGDEQALYVFASRLGGVGVAWLARSESGTPLYVLRPPPNRPDYLAESWRAAQQVVDAMGGYGPAYLSVYVHPGLHDERFTDGLGPTDHELSGVVRNLRRAAGELVPEDD